MTEIQKKTETIPSLGALRPYPNSVHRNPVPVEIFRYKTKLKVNKKNDMISYS